MTRPIAVPHAPRGFAFPIAELQTIQRWAQARRLALTIALDRRRDGADVEEAIGIFVPETPRRAWCLWRAAEYFVLEPPSGPPLRYPRLIDALAALHP